MVMDAQEAIGRAEEFRAEIIGGSQWHVAATAIELRLFGVIKAAGAVAGNSAQQVGIIMILPAQELLVLRQFDGQADLVAGGTKLRLLVQRLQERLLMKLRFGFDQL